jgi:hypothetical protein
MSRASQLQPGEGNLINKNLTVVLAVVIFVPCAFAQGRPSKEELATAVKAYRLIAERYRAKNHDPASR